MSKGPRRDFRLYLTKDLAFKLDMLCSQNGIEPVDLVSGAIQHLWLMAEKEIADRENIELSDKDFDAIMDSEDDEPNEKLKELMKEEYEDIKLSTETGSIYDIDEMDALIEAASDIKVGNSSGKSNAAQIAITKRYVKSKAEEIQELSKVLDGEGG